MSNARDAARPVQTFPGERDWVGRAQELLMERSSVTRDQALNILVRASRRAGIELSDMAQQLITAEDDRRNKP